MSKPQLMTDSVMRRYIYAVIVKEEIWERGRIENVDRPRRSRDALAPNRGKRCETAGWRQVRRDNEYARITVHINPGIYRRRDGILSDAGKPVTTRVASGQGIG